MRILFLKGNYRSAVDFAFDNIFAGIHSVSGMTDIERIIEAKKKEIISLEKKLKIVDSKIEILQQNSFDIKKKEDVPVACINIYPLSSLESLSSNIKIIGIRYNEQNYECQESDVVFEIVKILDKKNPLILEDLILSDFSDSEGNIILSFDASMLKKPKEVRNGLFIEIGMDTKFKKRELDCFLKEYESKEDDFKIIVQE